MRAIFIASAIIVAATSAQAQDIGVPSCDRVLKTYQTCVIAKAPADAQAQMKAVFDQMRTNWAAVAATPEGKTKLQPACTQAADQMKQQLASFNCQW